MRDPIAPASPSLAWRLARSLARLLLPLALLPLAAGARAETLVAGPQDAPLSLAAALAQAKDGDVIELLPGEYLSAGWVLENRRLTLRGVGPNAPVIRGPDAAKGLPPFKALLLVRGGEVTVENIEWRNARSMQGDGAALRLEGGKLLVRASTFFDNEYGLATSNDDKAELRIENSVFGMAPRVVGGLYHLLNVGRIAKLEVTGSRFQQGFEGHLIKTRARENLIAYNFIHDGARGGASYEIDIAAGGLATVIGNVIGQGSETQNPVLVAYGSEGPPWDRNELRLAHNTLISYGLLPAWYLRVFRDKLPEATEVLAVNNLTVGPGLFWLGARGHFDGNRPATMRMLRDADTYAFELQPDSWWRGSGIDPRNVKGRDLSPKAEFEWPVGTRKLEVGGRSGWAPGAYQR